MDRYFVALLLFIALILGCMLAAPFVLYLLIECLACLGGLCMSFFDCVEDLCSRIRQMNLPDMHLTSFLSRRNGSADSLPVSTRPWRSPVVNAVHRVPNEADTPPADNDSEGTQYINIWHAVPDEMDPELQHVATRMLYAPSSSPAMFDESRIHVNARAYAPHQRMVPEPREGPNRPNMEISTYITASAYQTYEDGTDTDCAVCLGVLETGEMVMRMPLCSHVYHEKCICRWLLQNPSCPLCRLPVRAHLSVTVGD